MKNDGILGGQKLLGSFLRLSSVFAIGLPLAVVTNIVLARTLSTADFGKYGLAIAFASVLSIPITSGMPMLLMREVSGYKTEKQWGRYHALMLTASSWALVYSIILIGSFLSYVYFANAQTVNGIDSNSILAPLIVVPILSGMAIAGGALRGFGQASFAAIPQQILLQIFLISGLYTMAQLGELSATHALYLYLAASLLAMFIMIVLLHHRSPARLITKGADYSDIRRWIKSYVPFMAIGAVGVLTTNLAILMLGYYGKEEAVAHLRVAERGAQLVTFPLIILNTVIGPRIVEHWKMSDIAGLRKLAQGSTRLLLLAVGPIALILLFFGKPILGFTFGEEYEESAYMPLVILVLAQLLFTALGSAGPILAMTGNENIIVTAQIAGLVVLLAVGALLIPSYNAVGGALGAAAGLLTMKFLLVAYVWRRLSFWSGIA